MICETIQVESPSIKQQELQIKYIKVYKIYYLINQLLITSSFFLQNQSKVKIVPNKFYNTNSNIINLRNQKISKCGNF